MLYKMILNIYFESELRRSVIKEAHLYKANQSQASQASFTTRCIRFILWSRCSFSLEPASLCKLGGDKLVLHKLSM